MENKKMNEEKIVRLARLKVKAENVEVLKPPR